MSNLQQKSLWRRVNISSEISQNIMKYQNVSDTIIDFIGNEVKKRNAYGIVIGLSGGLDSSVSATLAVRALGPLGVFGLILPDSKITPKSDVDDARELAKNLKIKYRIIEIGKTKSQLLQHLPKDKLAQGNFASRLRMSIIYYYAGIRNLLVLGTSDKSELKLGYYTKYGDGAADIQPMADLYKTEVRELGKFLHVSYQILKKKSSPRMWKGQTAEDEIGMSYEEIDEILLRLETNSLDNYDSKNVNKIVTMIQKNLHKQEMPPICKLRDCI
jgi:NAD+ synthase